MLAQLAHHGGGLAQRYQVRHQQVVAIVFFVNRDQTLAHIGMSGQNRFDFTQLDAVPPDLDLVVKTPQKFNRPIRQVAHQVPGLVETRLRSRHKGIGHKGGGRALGIIQIATPHTNAADVQFTRHPNRGWLQPVIQNIQPHIGHRPANRNTNRIGRQRFVNGVMGDIVGAFGRPVSIHQRNVRIIDKPLAAQMRRERFTGQ